MRESFTLGNLKPSAAGCEGGVAVPQALSLVQAGAPKFGSPASPPAALALTLLLGPLDRISNPL